MASSIDLTTIDAVKGAITLPDGDTDLDAELPNYITQASRAILNYCKREFTPTSTVATRRFKVDSYHIDLTPYDLQSASAVVLHPETTGPVTLSATQYMLKPINPQRGVYQSVALSNFLSITSQTLMAFGYALMDITGTWGFVTIPEDVVRAANITVGAWITRTAPGASSGYGIPPMAGGGATMFRNDWDLPWAACKLLGRFRRGSARWV